VAEESSVEIASRLFIENCQLGAAGTGFVAEDRRSDLGHGNEYKIKNLVSIAFVN